jgi:hypothetical protein
MPSPEVSKASDQRHCCTVTLLSACDMRHCCTCQGCQHSARSPLSVLQHQHTQQQAKARRVCYRCMDRRQAAANWSHRQHTAAESLVQQHKLQMAASRYTANSPPPSAIATAASTQPAIVTATTTLQAVAAHQTAGLPTTSRATRVPYTATA